METRGYESQELNHLGIIAGICEEIELIKKIDEAIETEREVTTGEAVQAMILNAMGFANRTLYLTPQFFANKPVGILIREGLEAQDFNDDTLGHALDALYERGITEVFAKVASHALQVYAIEHDVQHLDSTSISLHGQYDAQEDTQGIKITYGYSRKHRPDLKQAVLSLICSYKSSIPTWLEVHNGNEVDKTLFPQIIDNYISQLQGSQQPCFVADSALYAADNLARLSRILWITRVPETITAAKSLVLQSDPQDMQQSEQSGYKYLEIGSIYGDVRQRWLVIYSQDAYQKEHKTLLKRIAREKESIDVQIKHLQAREFFTERAGRFAVQDLQKSWSYHQCSVQIHTHPSYGSRRGRPSSTTQPIEILYKVTVTVQQDLSKISLAMKSLGKFILATNQLDCQKMSCSKILDTYKSQPSSVERGFRFLNDPLFFASGIFLKKPSRIMALLMVMGLSLLVYSLAERKLRRLLADNHEFVPNQAGKPVQNPTLRWVFQIFHGIHVLIIKELSSFRLLVLNLTPLHHKIIQLLGPFVEKCYFFA